ncbi:MAG: DUF4340 domain-containing protein [Syntrophobacteraceae bacterium]|jgi:hypothetical protein|nr:DUF4340 domain-containing protein [Syntrophobacteraceae bacterium]
MKWRHSLIYLAVLLVIAGYYYFFEVVKQAEREKAEAEAKKIFSLQADQISALELSAPDKPQVRLKREEGEWRITDPVASDVEKSAVESLVSTLAGLSWEVEVAREAQDFKPFGLTDPVPLKIRFTAGDRELELLVGEKNPVGRGTYARRGDASRVFLLETANWSLLNKGLDELRRRALFTFTPEEVTGLSLEWADGAGLHVLRDGGSDAWRAPERADMKIKESKVRNVIEQVQWLRAQSFVEEGLAGLESHGLMPPHARIRLQLVGERTAELTLAVKDADAARQIKAASSELPAVVQVDAGILEDLPRDLPALEDRSLIGVKSRDVKEVRWTLGQARGHAVQLESNQWELRAESGQGAPLKEPWHLSSLLWDLQQAEYQRKVEPTPESPQEPHARMELLDAGRTLAVLTWEGTSGVEQQPAGGAASKKVWVEEGGQTTVFEVSREALQKAEESLTRVLSAQSEK